MTKMGNDNPYSDMFEAYVAHLYHNMKGSSRNKLAIIRTYFVLMDLRFGFSIDEMEDHRILSLRLVLSNYLGKNKDKNDDAAQRLFTKISKSKSHEKMFIL